MDLHTAKIIGFWLLSMIAIYFGLWLAWLGFTNYTDEDAIIFKETFGKFHYNFLMLVEEIIVASFGVTFILVGFLGITLTTTILRLKFF